MMPKMSCAKRSAIISLACDVSRNEKCDPKLRIKIYPELMPGAMGWFRSSALVTVIVGLRYFTIHLASNARAAGARSLICKRFGWWLMVRLGAHVFMYTPQHPRLALLNH